MNKKIIEELVNRYVDELDDGKFDNIIYGALEKNVFQVHIIKILFYLQSNFYRGAPKITKGGSDHGCRTRRVFNSQI